jgi:hypothetical protein
MSKVYGFTTETYEGGATIETLTTGDGKAQFTDISYEDGSASIGISYGLGDGIGTKQHHNKKVDESMLIKWQVKFDNQQSIDSMIETLLRVKNRLNNPVIGDL